MLFISLIGLAALGHAARGSVIDPDIGVPGAFETLVEWDVQAFPNGEMLSLKGTVQQVHEQLVDINPNYDADFHLEPMPMSHQGLERRDSGIFSGSNVICDAGLFGRGSVDALEEGINYLRRLSGQPRNGGGPGNCGRVSCSYGTAIWWCNDSKEPKTLGSWGAIADGAHRVWTVCAGRLDKGFGAGQVSGQAFHSTDWNVIVRTNSC